VDFLEEFPEIVYYFFNQGLALFIKNRYDRPMLKAAPAQPTAASRAAALAGFTPQPPRQFRAAELTADPASGSRFTVHGSRFTVHIIH
jgi:hypothetical protein